MAKFEQSSFTVGPNSGQAHKNYVDNYDVAFEKKSKTKCAKCKQKYKRTAIGNLQCKCGIIEDE